MYIVYLEADWFLFSSRALLPHCGLDRCEAQVVAHASE